MGPFNRQWFNFVLFSWKSRSELNSYGGNDDGDGGKWFWNSATEFKWFYQHERCTVVFDNPNSKRINGETDTISVEA